MDAASDRSPVPSQVPVIHVRRAADRHLCETLLGAAPAAGPAPPAWMVYDEVDELRFLSSSRLVPVHIGLPALERRIEREAQRFFNYPSAGMSPWTLVVAPAAVRRIRFEAIAAAAAGLLVCRLSLSRARCVLDNRAAEPVDANVGDALVFSSAYRCEELVIGTKATSLVALVYRR